MVFESTWFEDACNSKAEVLIERCSSRSGKKPGREASPKGVSHEPFEKTRNVESRRYDRI